MIEDLKSCWTSQQMSAQARNLTDQMYSVPPLGAETHTRVSREKWACSNGLRWAVTHMQQPESWGKGFEDGYLVGWPSRRTPSISRVPRRKLGVLAWSGSEGARKMGSRPPVAIQPKQSNFIALLFVACNYNFTRERIPVLATIIWNLWARGYISTSLSHPHLQVNLEGAGM